METLFLSFEPVGASTKIATIGIDPARNVFSDSGVDEHGGAVFNTPLNREQMAVFFVNLPACLIGLEACANAHHLAGKLQTMGHTVRLMAPQFVKHYVKINKNDAADAQVICEAVARPMRGVPIKSVEQQGSWPCPRCARASSWPAPRRLTRSRACWPSSD